MVTTHCIRKKNIYYTLSDLISNLIYIPKIMFPHVTPLPNLIYVYIPKIEKKIRKRITSVSNF
jgi:hypothetical protein